MGLRCTDHGYLNVKQQRTCLSSKIDRTFWVAELMGTLLGSHDAYQNRHQQEVGEMPGLPMQRWGYSKRMVGNWG